jgi:hypothetical protein
MAISKTDGISAGVTVIATAIGFMIGGPKAAAVLGVVGVLVVLYFHFLHQDTVSTSSHSMTDQWKELAAKFSRFPPSYVRAEWLSETIDWEGKPVGEQWDIRDDWKRQFADDCESLCKLAGAMLLKSPKISPHLSQRVKSRSNDAWRWLYFLTETRGSLKITGTGETVVRGFRKANKNGTISELAPESARACIECAAKEL